MPHFRHAVNESPSRRLEYVRTTRRVIRLLLRRSVRTWRAHDYDGVIGRSPDGDAVAEDVGLGDGGVQAQRDELVVSHPRATLVPGQEQVHATFVVVPAHGTHGHETAVARKRDVRAEGVLRRRSRGGLNDGRSMAPPSCRSTRHAGCRHRLVAVRATAAAEDNHAAGVVIAGVVVCPSRLTDSHQRNRAFHNGDGSAVQQVRIHIGGLWVCQHRSNPLRTRSLKDKCNARRCFGDASGPTTRQCHKVPTHG